MNTDAVPTPAVAPPECEAADPALADDWAALCAAEHMPLPRAGAKSWALWLAANSRNWTCRVSDWHFLAAVCAAPHSHSA